MSNKICPRCKLEKEEIEFYKNKSARDGLNIYCKSCWKHITKKFQKTPKGQAIQKRYYTSEQGKKHRRAREKRYLQSEKGRAKVNARHCKRYHKDIEYSRLKNNSRYAGVPVGVLKKIQEKDKVCQLCGAKENLQFDHIYPIALGGVGKESNLQLLCSQCNIFKSNNLLLPKGGMIVT